MDNMSFKSFIQPYVTEAIHSLGDDERVAEMFKQLPQETTYYIAGVVCGLVSRDEVKAAPWRDAPLTPGATLVVSREEIRRVLDVVHLRLDTGSSTP